MIDIWRLEFQINNLSLSLSVSSNNLDSKWQGIPLRKSC